MASYHPVILDILTKASSQNPELIKLAEQQLKSLEIETGYYPMLMDIVLDRALEVNIRWLAAVCVKNGIDRYWRKSAPNAIALGERAGLKQKFLICFDEPVNIIATQIACAISKVARMDFPSDWPELFPAIINAIQWPEDLHQQRGLLVLHHVVKTLASKRLIGDQQMFKEMTASLFPSVFQLWTNQSNVFLQGAQNQNSNHGLQLEKCVFCLKVLRKLVVYGFKHPSEKQEAINFMTVIFQQFKPFIEYRKCMQHNEVLRGATEKYLVLLTKVLLDVLEQHASFFVQFTRPALECAVLFCFAEEYRSVMFERLIIGFLKLIKGIVADGEFSYRLKGSEDRHQEYNNVCKICDEFFTQPVLQEILQQLVMKYFLLTEDEVEMWKEHAEEFAIEERGESWKYNLRPCAEVLFLSFLRRYNGIVIPVVVNMVKEAQCLKSDDFDAVLKKEAVLNCVGLACYEMFNEMDFSSFFSDYLIPELQVANHYVLRRRIVWLLGQIISRKAVVEEQISFYEVIIQVLDPKENLLVRLCAANALKSAVDVLEFDVDKFMPFLEGTFGNLFHLLKGVTECDLKMLVLHVLSFLIERVGKKICLHTHSLISYLFDLWESCGDHMMLRCSIVSCLTELVCSLSADSMNLHSFIIPMIAFSTDVNLPAHVYLLDDALDLWNQVLENASSCSPDLLDLAKYLMPLFECGRTVFDKCLDITNAYILLIPNEFLQRFGEALVQVFSYVLTDLVPEVATQLMSTVENVLIVFPTEGAELFKPVIAVALSMLLRRECDPYGCSILLSLISRVILHNQNCFGSLLQHEASETKQEVEKVFSNLLDTWLSLMPEVPTIFFGKLFALALLCLLTTDTSVVLDRICGIILAVVEVLNDVTGVHRAYRDTNTCNDVLVMDDEDLRDEEDDTFHERRLKPFKLKDPVYTVVLKDYLKSQLSALEHSAGRTKFEDLMSTIDVETMEQLRNHLKE